MYVLLKIISYASLDYNLPGSCNYRSYLWIWWNCGGCCWNSKSPVLPVFDTICNITYYRNGPTPVVTGFEFKKGLPGMGGPFLFLTRPPVARHEWHYIFKFCLIKRFTHEITETKLVVNRHLCPCELQE